MANTIQEKPGGLLYRKLEKFCQDAMEKRLVDIIREDKLAAEAAGRFRLSKKEMRMALSEMRPRKR